MAFLKTSDSIVIQATLTEKGKKLLSRGDFKVAKFALGDDEIDYSLFNVDKKDSMDPADVPALLNSLSLEAYRQTDGNIQYGLDSYDDGVLYLKQSEISEMDPGDIGIRHAALLYLPILKNNTKLSITPSLSGSCYYISANDETTEKLDSIEGFKFLSADRIENVKFVVESGILLSSDDLVHDTLPTRLNRQDLIIKKYLIDMDYFIYADNRFITALNGITQRSTFVNYPSGYTKINFVTGKETSATSYPRNEFPNFVTYVARGIPNQLYVFPDDSGDTDAHTATRMNYTEFNGPGGGVIAFNPKINRELSVSSDGQRDFRYSDYGEIEQIVFSELPTSKFDYIETTIYIIGATTNARLQIPLRIIRYVGT